MAIDIVKRRETVDIIGDLVALIDTTVVFKTVVDNNPGNNSFTITTCNTKYIQPTKTFTYNAVVYTVIDETTREFVPNEKFTVTGASVPLVGTLTLDPMKYFHGTVIATVSEFTNKNLDVQKFPMVFLREVLRDTFNNNIEDKIDRDSDLNLFFLINTDESNWDTDKHYTNAIVPMRNMVYEFIKLLNDTESIADFDSYTATNHAKFGIVSIEKGHTRRIFNAKSSGVEVNINVPIIQSQLCNTCN